MKHIIKDYFTFNKRERNGVFILLSIIIVLILFLTFYDSFLSVEKVDFTEFDKQIAKLDSLKKAGLAKPSEGFISGKSNKNIQLFPFDPNNLSDEKWLEFGLSNKQIRIIKNYEAKGGKFYKKEDLKKIYGIPVDQYEKLEPYISIPEREKFKKFLPDSVKKPAYKKSLPASVELNSADSALLVTLPGIGPVFAQRIIKYKNSLGGFIAKEQLLEVYGITQETLDQIYLRIRVNKEAITKININTAIFSDLKKHPYIKYNIANALINYRKAHGNYNSLEDIKKIDIITTETYQKLESYFTIK